MNAFLTLLAVAALAQESWSEKTFPAKGIQSVTANASAGPVELLADPRAESIRVQKIGEDPEGRCKFTVFQAPGALTVKAENTKKMGRSCDVGLAVYAPDKITVSGSSGSGAVSVRGFAGKSSAKSGSGRIGLESLRGEISAKTGSGEIRGVGLTGNFEGGTGSGPVILTWPNDAPKRITVSTGSGDVKLSLPKGSKLTATTKTGSGKVTSEFGTKPGGKTIVDVKTGSGDISILENK